MNKNEEIFRGQCLRIASDFYIHLNKADLNDEDVMVRVFSLAEKLFKKGMDMGFLMPSTPIKVAEGNVWKKCSFPGCAENILYPKFKFCKQGHQVTLSE